MRTPSPAVAAVDAEVEEVAEAGHAPAAELHDPAVSAAVVLRPRDRLPDQPARPSTVVLP